MSIKSPETYGEHYWGSQVDATRMFDEETEQSIKGFIPSLFTDPEIRAAVPFDILAKLEGLFQFEHAGLGEVGGRFVSEAADNVVGRLLDAALKNFGWASNRFFADEHITSEQTVTLKRRRRISEDFANQRLAQYGYSTAEQVAYYEASAPYPSTTDLIRWGRAFAGSENMRKVVELMFDIPDTEWNIWQWLGEQQYTTDQITRMYRRGTVVESEYLEMMDKIGWSHNKAQGVGNLSYLIPNAMLLLQADLLNDTSDSDIRSNLGIADIHPDYHQHYIDAVLTKPASADLIAYHLRQENDLVNLDTDLKRIGIHPKYVDIYKTLAQQIPPVNDIITMAVREAFSPATAERFGQYEDFPEDFARFAGMQGVSEDWAKRYWAAHWALPSLTQGFNMFHRGIIGHDDLELLLKAQDTMPFWRGKLIQMAYKPLTRVDVRRMYKEGVLDESGVYAAYLNIGYSADNAKNMTEFTLRQTLSSMAKFSSTDVVRAYSQGMIDESEAKSILRELGIKGTTITYIISTADYKIEWENTERRIAATRNLYRKGEYNENKTRSELLKLDLPTKQVDDLMDSWWYEKKADGVTTWSKAETMKFLKAELITEERAKQELANMGYDPEHIDMYIEVIKLAPKTN